MEKYYKLPKEDINTDEALITALCYKNGDQVKKGDILYSFETTKANIDVEAEDDGYIHYYVEIDQSLESGFDVCVITTDSNFKLVKQKVKEEKGSVIAYGTGDVKESNGILDVECDELYSE